MSNYPDMDAFRAAVGSTKAPPTPTSKDRPAPAPPGPESLPRLSEGDVGEDVLHWQTWLVSQGFTIDLKPQRFGPQTVAATIAFQRGAGLTGPDVTGRNVGPRTLRAAWDKGYRG